MKKIIILVLSLSVCIPAVCKSQKQIGQPAVNIILDTDIGNDIDDAEALALLYHYLDEGRINLLGICLNKKGEETADFVDLMGSFYGHAGIPMGRARNAGNDGSQPASKRYTGKVCAMTNPDGSPLFKRGGVDFENLPDGHILYRKLLASQPDNSVTIVSIGFLTNLARLLDTPGDEYSPLTGKELVARKVKLLSIMAGRFFDDVPECNVVINIPAAQKVFSEWPTELVSLTWELGHAVHYPAGSMEKDFSWVAAHPLKEAYIRYHKMPYNNDMFDPTAVVYAVEGEKFFTSSGPGTIHVDDKGTTTFQPSADGRHSYMSVTEEQIKALEDYFVGYLTKKPAIFEKGYYENPVVRSEAPDPSVFRDKDGTYYMYVTGKNYPIYKSRDMVNWERAGSVFTEETYPKLVRNGRKAALWAPEIRLIKGKYVVFYTMWFGECWKSAIAYAVADSPLGPFEDKGILIDSREVNVEQSIDQFYFEDKGKSYIFWGSFRDIYVAELKVRRGAEISLKTGTMHKFAGNAYEGSNIWKRGKYYYFIGSVGNYSGGPKSTYRTVVARSKNVLGPYLDKDGVDIMQNGYTQILARNKAFSGPGHNAGLIMDDAGQTWMYYHAYELQDYKSHKYRQGMLDKVEWDEDGWPYIVGGTPSVRAEVPVVSK